MDASKARFDDEVDVNVRMKYVKEKPKMEILFDKEKENRTDSGAGARPAN